jgi:hypothetical protein
MVKNTLVQKFKHSLELYQELSWKWRAVLKITCSKWIVLKTQFLGRSLLRLNVMTIWCNFVRCGVHLMKRNVRRNKYEEKTWITHSLSCMKFIIHEPYTSYCWLATFSIMCSSSLTNQDYALHNSVREQWLNHPVVKKCIKLIDDQVNIGWL